MDAGQDPRAVGAEARPGRLRGDLRSGGRSEGNDAIRGDRRTHLRRGDRAPLSGRSGLTGDSVRRYDGRPHDSDL